MKANSTLTFGLYGTVMHVSKIGSARLFLFVLMLMLIGSSSTVSAQQPGKVYRIGYLTPFPIPPTEDKRFKPFYQLLEHSLSERGYLVGKNLSIEYRTSEGH